MPHTLLLADDSVTIQRVIELTFADEDIRVVAVGNGEDAIAFVDRTPPDIVLADVGMPGRSGYEVAQHIKQNPRLAHIPVLLLTGAFEPVDQAQVAAVGSDGVLAKPFEPQLVIGRVRELLAKGGQPAAAAPPVAPQAVAGSNDYFDRLDQAFSNLAVSKAAESTARPPAAAPSEIDWFPKRARADQPIATAWDVPAASVPDLPLSHGAPLPDFDRLGDLGMAPDPPAVAPPPPVPTAPPAAPAPAPAPEAVSQELVERVTRRVLDQLSDRVVRETVAQIVSEVAERLVRQEIERIKASIK